MKTTPPEAHTVHGQPVRLQDTNVAARFASGMRTITCIYLASLRCLPIVCRRNNQTALNAALTCAQRAVDSTDNVASTGDSTRATGSTKQTKPVHNDSQCKVSMQHVLMSRTTAIVEALDPNFSEKLTSGTSRPK